MNIIVTGGCSGLGKAIVNALRADDHDVQVIDHSLGDDVRDGIPVRLLGFPVDVLINCAGINKIAWLDNLDGKVWDETMDTNTKALWKCTQQLLPQLRESKGTVLNIVSNAAHMPMRCSAAYNASKGAALILTKQMARELSGDGITVFSVSPNKLKGTGMSDDIDRQVCETRGWTLEEAQAYQTQSLLTGEETPPRLVAEFIAFLLNSKDNHRFLTGCDIPYGV